MLKSVLRAMIDTVALLCGGVAYALTGRTPSITYQSMTRFFCRTGGRSNDLMCRWIRLRDRGIILPAPSGDLGVSNLADAERIAERIRSDGYYVFDQRLPGDVCDRLLRFALETRARVRPMKGQVVGAGNERHEIYDRYHPLAVRYDFDTDEVLSHPDVQRLLASPSVLSVAHSYLKTTPIADVISMWWHTAFSDQPDEEAAQFFHFDMDRIKWLKFFIYLTDVGPDNGPHCFIKGSHRTGGIPSTLLSKGYARLTDEEVFRHFPQRQMIQFLAPRGTIIAEDTRGLHKGLEVRSGDRLMLQIQFSNSLFGGTYPPARLAGNMTPSLSRMIGAYPAIYANYLPPHSNK